MAITRARVVRALENYIPSSIAVSKDPETNLSDPEEVFQKLQTMVSVALVLDPNSVFYLISIVLGEVLNFADGIISDAESLASQDVLLSAEQSLPSRITDTEDLTKASSAISDLATSSSSEAAKNLNESISNFQNEQLKPLVEKRNTKLVEEDIKSLSASLRSSLDGITSYLARVTSAISDYEEIDVKAVALAHVAKTARIRILQIKEEIENTSSEDQSQLAEDILVDLAAAKVALTTISEATEAKGEVVVSATPNGFTKQTYLAAQGVGQLIPRTYVSKGASGNIFVDYIMASTQGTATAEEYQVTASISPETRISFPLTVSSAGTLSLVANGVSEEIEIPATTFLNVSVFISFYNAAATITQAYATNDERRPFAIYAFDPSVANTGANPVGKDSTLAVSESSSEAVLGALAISSTASSTGSLSSAVVKEGVQSLSSFTFPSTTTTFGEISSTSFDCALATLDGVVHTISSISLSENTFTVSPPIPVAIVTNDTTGLLSYSAAFSYVVTKTSTGSLFESGSGGNTTKLVDDPSGTPVDSFLLSSAGSTGGTGSTRIQHPNAYTQATATITVSSARFAGDTITINGVTLTSTREEVSAAGSFQTDLLDPEVDAQSLVDAINSSVNGLTSICTATRVGSVVTLTAAYYSKRGTAGNSITLSTSNVGGYAISSFSGGEDLGSTWDGIGEYGGLEKISRLSGTDGTNMKESTSSFLSARVGKRKASGTAGGSNAGVAYKTYGSESGPNWYLGENGTWGKKTTFSTATAGAAASPSTTAPTNMYAFDATTSAPWTSDTSKVYFDGSNATLIESGDYFVLESWAEYPSGSNVISGPYDGVGANSANYPSPPHYSGSGGTVFLVTTDWSTFTKYFTITSPDIDEDGDGVVDSGATGLTWSDKGWTKSPTSSSAYLTMFGYTFSPDNFIIPTPYGSEGFTQTYTTPTGVGITPQVGDTIIYEWTDTSSGTTYRQSREITVIVDNLEIFFTPSSTPSGDLGYRIDDPWKAQTPVQRTGVKYTISRDTAVDSTKFFADTNLISAGVIPGDYLYISTSGSNQGWYLIDSIASANEVLISSAGGTAPDGSALKTSFAYPQDVTWEIRDADYKKRLTDTAASFISNGVSAGDTLTILTTSPSTPAFVGSFEIEAVESETELLVTTDAFDTTGGSAPLVTYRVPLNDSLGGETNQFFKSEDSNFFGNVFAGDILTTNSTDFEVESVEDANTLKIKSYEGGPSVFTVYFSGRSFSVRRGQETSGTYSGQETTNKFKIDVSLETGLSDLQDIDGIEVSNRIDINPSGISERKDGYLVIKEGDYAGTYGILSVSELDGDYQYVFIDTYLPFSDPASLDLSWEVLAGLTTNTFTDEGSVDRFLGTISSSSKFSVRAPKAGDDLVVELSDGTYQHVAIKSVDYDDEITLESPLTQSLSGLRYSLLPAEYPQIGDDLVVRGYRVPISDIRLATDKAGTEKAVLVLSSPIPLTLGAGLPYFVTTSGADPFSTFLQDEDPNVEHDLDLELTSGFKTADLGDLTEATIQISDVRGSFSTTVYSVVDESTLRLSRNVEALLGDVFYRILTDEPGKSSTLIYTPGISTSVQEGDYLSIWQVPLYQTVVSKTDTPIAGTNINFTPQTPSGLSGLDFAVTRGGSVSYGKYLLLSYKIENLNKRLNDYQFRDLNLRLAEVIATNGTDRVSVKSSSSTSSAVATAPDDGDGDETTNRFDISIDSSKSFSGVRVGDRVSLTYQDIDTGDTNSFVCWISLESDRIENDPLSAYDAITSGSDFGAEDTRCIVIPEVPVSTSSYRIIGWEIERNSISFALNETTRLRLIAEEVRDIVELYTVVSSANVDAVLSMIESEGYDRLSALLKSGQLTEFFGADYTSSTYQDLMASTVREAGALLLRLKNGG